MMLEFGLMSPTKVKSLVTSSGYYCRVAESFRGGDYSEALQPRGVTPFKSVLAISFLSGFWLPYKN